MPQEKNNTLEELLNEAKDPAVRSLVARAFFAGELFSAEATIEKVKAFKVIERRKHLALLRNNGAGKSEDPTNDEVTAIIDAFKQVNPSYKMLFSNRTQRKSAKSLLQRYGFDMVLRMVHTLNEVNGKPYAPTITTPYELEVNLGKLIAFARREKEMQGAKKPKIEI